MPVLRAIHRCQCCGRPLTDPISIARRYGPECAERLGIITIRHRNTSSVGNNAQPSVSFAQQKSIWDFM
jgi:hypothetical protein